MNSDSSNDSNARDRIVGDLDTNFLVEASAGTGKTYSLVGRLVALLREGRAEMRNIVAVTFTVKAAGELRRRFQDVLEQCAREEGDETRATRLRNAIDAMSDITIGTIHSFCAGILREYPLQAGVTPAFTVLEEADAKALQQSVWTHFIDTAPLDHADKWALIDGMALKADDLEKAYGHHCQWPDIDFTAEDADIPDLDEAVSRISALVEATLPGIRKNAGTRNGLQSTLLKAASLLKAERDVLRDVRLLSLFISETACKVTLKEWTDQGEAKILRDELLPQLRQSYLLPAWRHVLAWRYAFLTPLLAEAARLYSQAKKSAGVMDNNDLLIHSRNLLRDHADIRARLAARSTHLLVDEFQDTDPVQAEMLCYLCSDGAEVGDWRALRLRPGALFAVGDPKQSIYRFRRADIRVYNDVRALLIASGGETLELSRNFRGVASLCHLTNSIFSSIFPDTATDVQPRHVPLDPARGDGGALSGAGILDVTYAGTNKAAHLPEAASAVAQWIAAAIHAGATIVTNGHDGPKERALRPSDVMILARNNDMLTCLAEALHEQQLPCIVEGGIPAGKSEELRLLLVLLKVLSDPEDETAMVAWLRSSWCGVDDAALLQWKRSGGNFRLTTRFLPDMDPRIERGLSFIKNSMRMLRSAPPGAAVSSMVTEYAMIAALTSLDRGDMRAAVFSSLLSLIRLHSTAGAPLIDITERLQQALHSEHYQSFGNASALTVSASLLPDDEAVRISTLHKAKGLEAPVLVMFTPTAFSSSVSTSVVTNRCGENSRGWMCISSGTHESRLVAAPKDWKEHEARERSFIEAEEQRLRYVAITRAKNYFVFITPARGDGLFPAETFQRHTIPAVPVFEAPKKRGINVPSTIPDAATVATDPRQRRSALHAHSFARYNASLMHTGHPPQTATVGRGAAFGTLMHRLLQQAVKYPECSIQDVTAALLSMEAIDNVSIDTVMQLYNDIRAHAFWKRIQNAERRMTEVPFALPHPSEKGLPGILRGDIDLVFLDETGWNIVDYKTDAVGDMLSAFTDYYAPQLRLYCDAWKQLTGEKATGYLWFLTPNEIVQVC